MRRTGSALKMGYEHIPGIEQVQVGVILVPDGYTS